MSLPIRIHLRIDAVTDTDETSEVVQTVLIDDKEVGTLRLTAGAYQLFGCALGLGAQKMTGHLAVTSDEIGHDADGNFCMNTKPKAAI